jgi:hypothetical protein
MTLEQLKLNYNEAEDCLGRGTIPTHHRVKNYAMSISKNDRNTGSTVNLYFGMDPLGNVGPQPEDSEYTPSIEFSIGGKAVRSGYVAYPLSGDVPVGGVALIMDRLVSPRVVMAKGVDYYVSDGSIIFREDRDPFGGLSSNYLTATTEGPDGPNTQLLLWGVDALFDDNYLEDHFGQLYDGKSDNLDYYKDLLNASGDLYASGTNILNMRYALGKLFGTPVAVADETVVDVYQEQDGSTVITTASNLYRARKEETLLSSIQVGYQLTQGEFMTETLRFYCTLNPNIFEVRNKLTLEQFSQDFPEINLRDGMAAVGGLSLVWYDTPLLYRGVDDNGNNRYSFNVSTDATIDTEFWEYVFNKTESEGVDMAQLFPDELTIGHSTEVGAQVGTISPVRYFLKNFLSANASALAVDFDSLPQYIRELDVSSVITAVSAVYTRILISVRVTAETDYYSLEDHSTERLTDLPASSVSDTAGQSGSLEYYDANVKIRRIKV